ncbi:ATP-dependent zinc metalloprotease FTSH 4, mitochondrial-like isoform X2 [Acropora millepora]|uniref:ATP-dependent zinc metalloprotease FTSH 4, mitochondrial-like isoform X2 n=1 Tax=Acropora millepora TaxID=45264 RepID=UPI001CF56F99|nr:ATP-dependent zinc metalloprotease FTSH 4, mitochondrial-like isoform X2 [Acropora millepora]
MFSSSGISPQDSYATFLGELGIASVPADVLRQLGTPLSVCHCSATNSSPWKVSHVSSESFFKNKHGFSSLTLSRPNPSRVKSNIFTSFTKLPWLHTSFLKSYSGRGYHSVPLRKIQQLEERANAEENNPRAQAEYLKALVQEDPNYVIQRYESGKYAVDDSVTKEYLMALVLAGKIGSANTVNLRQRSPVLPETMPASAAASIQTGTEENPTYVIMQNQKGAFFKEQLWNTFRFLIALFLVLSLIEAQLQMKMSSNQKDIQPDSLDRNTRFTDVQGVEEAKQELKDVVEFLRDPERFKRLGGKMPTGVLLTGRPGTGKTLLAKAVAGEAGVPFFFCSGSEFDEMFVGVGAARVRNLFSAAREHAPCIVFIDELDAIGGTRIVHEHQPYSRMTLNQLLVELDGFDKSEGIVVIGATNFPEILDKALVRPGRFDTKIHVPMPDIKGRHDILKLHLKTVEVADDVNIEVLARGTTGFSGADLANLVNAAAIYAAAEGDQSVTTRHLEFARDKILMGPERKSAVIEAKNREMVAYHEGGHALVALYTPAALPIYKATIVPRGSALGMVAQLPEKDELNWSKAQLLARLDVAMGGRVAEEIIFGKENVTTGAASDMESSTKLARAMVTMYGMSDKVGMIQIKDDDKSSPELQALVENEIKQLLKESYERAKTLLQAHSKEHNRLAQALLKYETLDLEEIKVVIQGRNLSRTL